jgi:hypothetical protein
MRRASWLLLCTMAFGQGLTITPKVTVAPKVTVSPGVASSSPTRVAGQACNSGGTVSATCTLVQPAGGSAVSIPAGTQLYVVGIDDVNTGTITITDNCNTGGTSDTFTPLDAITASGTQLQAGSWTATVGATTNPCVVTIVNNQTAHPAGAVYAVTGSGVDGAAHRVNSQTFPGTGTNAITSLSVTSSHADLCVGTTNEGFGSNDTIVAGSSTVAWSGKDQTLNPLSQLNEDFTQGAGGAITATFTTPSSFSQDVTFIVCFAP